LPTSSIARSSVRARPVWQHGARNGWQAWRGVTRGWGWAVAQSALA
jgi:hypothetical protein